ncbi:MAG: glycosyltransferase family 9 protein, partial [Opitutaceae bacterium]
PRGAFDIQPATLAIRQKSARSASVVVHGISKRPRLLLGLDRYLGVPACFALTVLRRVFGRRARRPAARPRSILFIKLAEQGSTVLAYRALAEAVRRVGRENVRFLVFEENRFVVDLLELLPAENVIAIRTADATALLASAWQRLKVIRRLRIDACVDLEFFTRSSAILSWLTGARIRVGFHTFYGEGPYRGDLLTHRVLYNPHLHTSETFLTLVAALDQDPASLPTFDFRPGEPAGAPIFRPAPEEIAAVREKLEAAGETAGRRLVLLNANCSDLLPLRRWPDASYLALARELLAGDDALAVAFTGAADESDRVNELVRAVGSPRCVSLAGRTTLRELLVLYGLAEVLVTNDSGPAHFAALTPIDAVTLFGPETPLLFGARGPRSHPIWAGVACSPCVNAYNNRQSACRNNVCMQRISVEEVLAAVEGILHSRAAAESATPAAAGRIR